MLSSSRRARSRLGARGADSQEQRRPCGAVAPEARRERPEFRSSGA